MKRYAIELQLLEDTIISESAATTGGHKSLDYIPGAKLLGVCASKLYSKLEKSGDAFLAFHSGSVRFGDALPVSTNGSRGRPMPLSRTHDKGKSPRVEINKRTYLQGLKLTTLSSNETIQQKQIRNGYVTDSLEYLMPESGLKMKTAINPQTGAAETGQLFGYQFLSAGQTFRSYLDIDESADHLASQVTDALQGEMYIGRSRSAEFGAVRSVVEIKPVETPPAESDASRLVLWCQSDLALHNDLGQPTTDVSESVLLVELFQGWTIDFDRTFVRTRAYSLFNSKRRCYDLQRNVIEAGSVIALERGGEKITDFASLHRQLAGGLGSYRECGLGQVEVNHPFVTKQECSVDVSSIAIAETDRAAEPPASTPNDAVVAWIESRTGTIRRRVQARELATDAADELPQLYDLARKYAGRPVTDLVGPSATQWSLIGQIGKQYQQGEQSDFGNICKALFEDKNSVCGQPDASGGKDNSDDDWSKPFGLTGAGYNNFAQWVRLRLQEKSLVRHGLFLMQLADLGRNLVLEIPSGVLAKKENTNVG